MVYCCNSCHAILGRHVPCFAQDRADAIELNWAPQTGQEERLRQGLKGPKGTEAGLKWRKSSVE